MNLSMFLLVVSLVILAGWAFQTDRENKARAKEAEFKKKLTRFKEAQGLVPKLMELLSRDLSDPQKAAIRDVFVISRTLSFEGGGGALLYYTEDYPDLEADFEVLQNSGYVSDVTRYNVRKYRMSDEFVSMLFYTPGKPKA